MIKLLKFFLPIQLNFGGGGGGNTSTVTEKSDPWAGQQPYLSRGFSEAWGNYVNETPEYYPNETFVDFAPQTLQALGLQQDLANENAVGYSAANEAFRTLSGDYINNNPYLNDITDRVSRDVSNSVNSQFAASNRMGSNAHLDTLSQSIADATAPIYGNAYAQERENMQRSLALAPQADQMMYGGVDRLRDVGRALETKEFESLQDDINRWNFAENQPDQQLANYMGLIQGNYGGSRNSTSVAPEYGGSPIMGALGGAATGASLGSALGLASPWGAIGGGLLGLFS